MLYPAAYNIGFPLSISSPKHFRNTSKLLYLRTYVDVTAIRPIRRFVMDRAGACAGRYSNVMKKFSENSPIF